MLIYEVNLKVDDSAAAQYAAWLEPHIEQMLRFPGFVRAEWYERKAEDEGGRPDGETLWTIHYYIKDRASLDRYLLEDAPRMRSEATERFGGRFFATRRILLSR